MLKNYFKIAFRSLWKNKTYSFINIFGLAVGTLCCLYILLYVQEQYSYDLHHKNGKDIYRINSEIVSRGDKSSIATSSPPIAPAMKNDFGEVMQYTRVIPTITVTEHLLRYKEKAFYEEDALFVDSTFFDVFTYHFVKGSPNGALNNPYSIVLSANTAAKLFGNEDPIGKTMQMENAYGKHDFTVMGVVDESLGKSDIHANMYMTMNSGGFGATVLTNTRWAGNNFAHSYVKLNPNTNAAALEKKLPAFLQKYGQQQLTEMGMQKVLHLQPVSTVHTTPGMGHELTKTVNPSFLYVLLLIALLIQVIACINFMNLSTARASKRAKEVGVRKVIGAGRWDLVRQFLGESLVLSFIGVLIALPLLALALPYLNSITKSDIHLTLFTDYKVWLILLGLIATTGLVAGSYPAFYLSAFRAIKVIKGNFSNHISAGGIRRSLVVFQFVLSIVLIAGIIIIQSQLHFINQKDLGFDKDQKLVFNFYTEDTRSRIPAFVNDLKNIPEVKSVTRANNYLGQSIPQDRGVFLSGGNMAAAVTAQNLSTDENFVKANGMRLASGRDLRTSDSGRVLINETLAKKLGLDPAKAVGARLYSQYAPDPAFYVEVAGVVKDFNFNSLRDEIRPVMLSYEQDASRLNVLTVSVGSSDYHALLQKIGAVWNKDLSGVPFDYKFLDDQIQSLYETEITLSHIINSFALMAILISCLGLFGLAAFSAEQRTKEIGIRKVLGASALNLTTLLSADFLKLVLIAIVIAVPVAWWATTQWLQAFTYRVPLSWWMFALAGAVAVFIALLTVSSQAIRAALANPVKSLRSE